MDVFRSGLSIGMPVEEAAFKNPEEQMGCPNMTEMTYLEEIHVLENMQYRYERKNIYTAINNILLAVNPYQDLGIYSSKHIKMHAQGATKEPHIFAVTNRAYRQLIRDEMNQSILVCGESGSGKTETAKLAMRFLTSIGPKSKGGAKKKAAKDLIEQRIIAVNPVLESFGNAKTTMNNNSSRFAKFTQILFSKFQDDPKAKTIAQKVRHRAENARIVGSAIQTYLLEKPRVVHQAPNEKNFHIFYQIFNLPKDKLKKLGLTSMKDFRYLGDKSETKWVKGQQNMYDKKTFEQTCESMEMLGFSEKYRDEAFRCIAGVLHLGNVSFASSEDFDRDQDAELQEKDKHHIKEAARLFDIDETDLTNRLMTYIFVVPREDPQHLPYKVPAARDNRDSITRNIYEGVFNDIVKRLNTQLHQSDDGDFKEETRHNRSDSVSSLSGVNADHAGGHPYIGVLDVFGFENFVENSFEQFSINFANETLQQLFDQTIIGDERTEYQKEGVYWGDEDDGMEKGNSEVCLVLLNEVYKALEESCRMDRKYENFVAELHSTLANRLPEDIRELLLSAPKRRGGGRAGGILSPGSSPRVASPRVSSGMLSPRVASPRVASPQGARRRKAGINEEFRIAHYAGEVTYTAKAFLSKNKDRVVSENAELFGTSKTGLVRTLFADQAPAAGAQQGGRGRGNKSKQRGIGAVFKAQMQSLMSMLGQTGCHFVRCLNPNNEKKFLFNMDYVGTQLRAGGIVAALDVIKKGYPTRKEFQGIYEMFAKCKPLAKHHEKSSPRDFVRFLLIVFNKEIAADTYKLGTTKLFFRPGQADKLDLLSESTESISEKQVARAESFFREQRFTKLRGYVKAIELIRKPLVRIQARKKFVRLIPILRVGCRFIVNQRRRVEAAKAIGTWYQAQQDAKNFNAFLNFCGENMPVASGTFKSLSQDEKLDQLLDAGRQKWGDEREEEQESDVQDIDEQDIDEQDIDEPQQRGVYSDEEEDDVRVVRDADVGGFGDAGDSDEERPQERKPPASRRQERRVQFAEESDDRADDFPATSVTQGVKSGSARSRRISEDSGPAISANQLHDVSEMLREETAAQKETTRTLLADMAELQARNLQLTKNEKVLATEIMALQQDRVVDTDFFDDADENALEEHIRRLTNMAAGIDSSDVKPKPKGSDWITTIQYVLVVLLLIQVLVNLLGYVPGVHNPRYAIEQIVQAVQPVVQSVSSVFGGDAELAPATIGSQ